VARPNVVFASDLKARKDTARSPKWSARRAGPTWRVDRDAAVTGVLNEVGVQPEARYVVYNFIEPDWWESGDMDDG